MATDYRKLLKNNIVRYAIIPGEKVLLIKE